MYKAIYNYYGNKRFDVIEAESYSHAQAIARKIYKEQFIKVVKTTAEQLQSVSMNTLSPINGIPTNY